MIDCSIPVLNQPESTQETLNTLKSLQSKEIRYIIVDNGSTPPVRDWLIGLSGDDIVIRNDKNVGLPKALNQAMAVSRADYVFHTHSDISMFEQAWDIRIEEALEDANKKQTVGVAGFYGAYGIGTTDIYRTPYVMQQLVRVSCTAGHKCRQNPAVHGHSQFHEVWKKVAVLDGFSLIVKNDGKLRFWDKSVHHIYDSQICLEAYDAGMQVICINCDVQHHGGRTDVGEDWATPFGKTKAEIHSEAHLPFYEMWRVGKRNISLPFRV